MRRLNELRKQRRLVSCGLEDVSSNKDEEDVPDLTDILAASMCPNSTSTAQLPVSQPGPMQYEATGSNAFEIRTHNQVNEPSTAKHNWHAAIASAIQPGDLSVTKNIPADNTDIGPVFKLSEASNNLHEIEIPFALKQMAQYRIFTQLSLFTAHSMDVICNNIGDLYTKKKTGSAAGKYVLNSDLFPNKDMLTETMFFQAYRNWIKLISELSEPEVVRGWLDHHECMISDTNFTALFEAWKSHDKQLHMSFFNAPYILDVKSSAYSKGFNKVWMNSFRKNSVEQ